MDNQQRIIAHFDLDTFFVSVERLNDPSLAGKPLIVGGRERGVVAACSYETRKFGVHSAMPMKTALKLCPQAIVLGGSRSEYSKYSRCVTSIIAARAPVYERASIDEFYLDLTGMQKYFQPYQWVIDLRKEITEKTKLPISFGLASNKMVAKMATDEAKPNGYLYVPFGREKEFLSPLRINKIPGVGDQTFKALSELGVTKIRELAEYPITQIEKRFGKYGIELHRKANGIHEGEVIPYHESKSISTESTFEENKTDLHFLMKELVRMVEKIAHELRSQDKVTGCIAIKIRYPDFETTTRQLSIPFTCYDDELIANAKELFHKLYRKGQPVRLLGARLSELTDQAIQSNLFQDLEKKSGMYKAIDELKERFGKNMITKGGGI
jgi:DNA polymerase-4